MSSDYVENNSDWIPGSIEDRLRIDLLAGLSYLNGLGPPFLLSKVFRHELLCCSDCFCIRPVLPKEEDLWRGLPLHDTEEQWTVAASILNDFGQQLTLRELGSRDGPSGGPLPAIYSVLRQGEQNDGAF